MPKLNLSSLALFQVARNWRAPPIAAAAAVAGVSTIIAARRRAPNENHQNWSKRQKVAVNLRVHVRVRRLCLSTEITSKWAEGENNNSGNFLLNVPQS